VQLLRVLVRRGSEATSEDDLMQWMNARVGKTQRLARLQFIEDLPRSAIGKVLKRELRERHIASGNDPA
jgi:long-chain acyl-CoA synthetase